MRTVILLIAVLLGLAAVPAQANGTNRLFATSASFDLIASLQYFEKIKDVPRFRHLVSDTAFMRRLGNVNENVTASRLCNFYATFNGNKHDPDSCVLFWGQLGENGSAAARDEEWMKRIVSLGSDVSFCISAINSAGYPEYWSGEIKPILAGYIDSYPVTDEILDAIHNGITQFSGPEELPDTHSNIYVLNIDNAFNLSDESFCCTPLLLDKEQEKQFRLDFLTVYTHENLHRLEISTEVMERLEKLKDDDFYREKEAIAGSHREGMNEAFVVAAEVYISHKLGRRDDRSVYDEFNEYVEGSLVLAPIVYVHLDEKRADETFNDFIMRLFDNGTLSVGSVRERYEQAMTVLQSRL